MASSLMKAESPNCTIGDNKLQPTVLYTYHSDKWDVPYLMMASCQNNHFETPDDLTLTQMTKVSEDYVFKYKGDVINVDLSDVTYTNLPLRIEDEKPNGKQLMKYKMASSCAPYYDIKNITSYNKYTCNYLGTGKDEKGRIVKNPFKTWSGTLPSCDSSMEITDQIDHDVKRLVYERADGDASALDINEFICNISSFPF